MNQRRAFTLIELMAVVVLIGLLAGAATWSMVWQASQATRTDVISRIAHADRMARLAAERSGRPCELVIDLDRQTLGRRMLREDGSVERAAEVQLPREFRIERVIRSDPAGAKQRSAQRFERGQVTVGYGPGGRSRSFAVMLKDKQQTDWLVWAGLSGQVIQTHDDKEADNIFELLGGGGSDAD